MSPSAAAGAVIATATGAGGIAHQNKRGIPMNSTSAALLIITMFGMGGISIAHAAPADPAAMDEAPVVDDAAAQDPAVPAGAGVVRAAFTTMMRDREPMDEISTLANDVEQIYFFTELGDMSGQRVTHRWQHNGDVMTEVSFDVRGPRWRVWSANTLAPQLLGTWTVSVLNSSGVAVHEATFDYVAAPSAAGQQAGPAIRSTP